MIELVPEFIEPVVALWLCSLALLTIGIAAHRTIRSRGGDNGLAVVRFLGVTTGGVGTIGIPFAELVNPYLTAPTVAETLAITGLCIVIGLVIGHVGWKKLGPSTPTSTRSPIYGPHQ